MKKTLICIGLLSLSSIAASKSLGAGFFLSSERGSGLDIKYFMDPANALDIRVGWWNNHHYYYDGKNWEAKDGYNHWTIQVDYQKHYYNVFRPSRGKAPFYLGIGGFLSSSRDIESMGIRMPLGFAYEFAPVPLDIFAELTPEVAFGYYDGFDVNVALGVRFWF